MRKLIFSDTLTLFSKNRLSQKSHVCPIEIGVFGHAEYEYNSPDTEFRHAKNGFSGTLNTNNIVPGPNSDMRKSIFSDTLTLFSENRPSQKGHVCPIEIGVFRYAEYE